MFEEHGRIVLTGDVAEDGVKALKKVTWAPSCMSTELNTFESSFWPWTVIPQPLSRFLENYYAL